MPAIQIRSGHVLEHDGRHWTVLSSTVLQPGKGGAFVQVEMRDVITGTKTNQRWRTQEQVERVRVDEHPCTFLYGDSDNLTLMDSQSYEQYVVPRALFGAGVAFVQDGMQVDIDFIDGKVVAGRLPASVAVAVLEAEPVVKGQTATSSYKSALVEGNVKVMVPPHITVGDKIVVNTADMTYVEKAK